jgi:CRP-like cAMP-binding protein
MPLTQSLATMDFFAGLDRKLLRKLEESAIVCQYEAGEVIIREGEMGLGMYVILSGVVEVSKNRAGAPVVLAQLGPEQFFAEMSLIDDKPRSATITTREETSCLLITRDSFTQLMEKNPQLSIRLARVLAERLRQADAHSQAVVTAPVPVVVVPVGPAITASNGSVIVNGAYGAVATPTGKAAVQQRLLDAFDRLYMAKAFTRFSVAVLGCPVEGHASNLIEEFRVGEVKALVVPADQPVNLAIEAYGAGAFNLHVFTPQTHAPHRFGPIAIQPRDRFMLQLPNITLKAHGRNSQQVTLS